MSTLPSLVSSWSLNSFATDSGARNDRLRADFAGNDLWTLAAEDSQKGLLADGQTCNIDQAVIELLTQEFQTQSYAVYCETNAIKAVDTHSFLFSHMKAYGRSLAPTRCIEPSVKHVVDYFNTLDTDQQDYIADGIVMPRLAL